MWCCVHPKFTMSVRATLAAMKELISTSPTSRGDIVGATSGLAESLDANLRSYREGTSYQELQRMVLHYKSMYHLTTNVDSSDRSLSSKLPPVQCVYLDFVSEALSLMLVLDEILCKLNEEDKRSASSQTASRSRAAAPPAPKSLLSISDQKTVLSLAQFIVSLGIFPYLLPPLDAQLRMKLSHVEMVEKCKDVSNEERAGYLHKSCRVLVQCFENPVLSSNLVSQHLCDVLVALIQITYASREEAAPRVKANSSSHAQMEQHRRTGVSELSNELRVVSVVINAAEREWCAEALDKLLNKTYQPLVVRELLVIQKIASIHGSTTRGMSINPCDSVKYCRQIL